MSNNLIFRVNTALENIADWERHNGKGINLTPIITELRDELQRLRATLQAKAEDYEHVVNENADLRRENARLKGQVEALREHVVGPSCDRHS